MSYVSRWSLVCAALFTCGILHAQTNLPVTRSDRSASPGEDLSEIEPKPDCAPSGDLQTPVCNPLAPGSKFAPGLIVLSLALEDLCAARLVVKWSARAPSN